MAMIGTRRNDDRPWMGPARRHQRDADWDPSRACRSDVQIGYLERVGFDEVATRFDRLTHQHGKYLVGGDRVLDTDLQQASGIGIHRGVPQLLRVHFTQALEALDAAAFLGFFQQPVARFGEAEDAARGGAASHYRVSLDQTSKLLADRQNRAKLGAAEKRLWQEIGRASCRE